ncbi:hypothetical protein FB45DRAFT_838592 [Roridomyces roridus]|uniref:Extracellular serine-rich protein n=1 Tax=Roridomyces roridus TaxID=1738132 RepID=A0AAD7BJI2_9AGAR|nr:hypothetical protein FB45DRAFT_838592 [Roridomyces roridus]
MLEFVVTVLGILPLAAGQATHMVMVGVQGSVYDPPTTSARLGDTVSFIFGGDAHSVTQSSFASPCIRLSGGFDSGFAGRGPQFAEDTPVWNLLITNESEPIWFFCQANIPNSHCEAGMVGAINPPSIAMYDQFSSAAKAVTSTPAPSPSFIASGQGAVATNSPMPTASSAPSSSSSSSSSSATSSSSLSSFSSSSSPPPPSVSPSAAPSSSGSGNHRAVVAGSTVAGTFILVVLLGLCLHQRRRWRNYRLRVSARPAPIGDLGEKGESGGVMRKAPPTDNDNVIRHAFPSMDELSHAAAEPDNSTMVDSTEATAGFGSPARAGVRPLPRTPSQKQLQLHTVDGSVSSDAAPQSPRTDINIDALAMEVAAVLLHTPPRPGSRGHQLQQLQAGAQGMGTRQPHLSTESGDTAASPPPHYRQLT